MYCGRLWQAIRLLSYNIRSTITVQMYLQMYINMLNFCTDFDTIFKLLTFIFAFLITGNTLCQAKCGRIYLVFINYSISLWWYPFLVINLILKRTYIEVWSLKEIEFSIIQSSGRIWWRLAAYVWWRRPGVEARR